MLRSLFNQLNHLGRCSPSGNWSTTKWKTCRTRLRFDARTTPNSRLLKQTSRKSFKTWMSARGKSLYSLRKWRYISRRLFFINATDTHAHFPSSHHGWEISHEGIPHFVVKYRLQQEEISEAKLSFHEQRGQHVHLMNEGLAFGFRSQVLDFRL